MKFSLRYTGSAVGDGPRLESLEHLTKKYLAENMSSLDPRNEREITAHGADGERVHIDYSSAVNHEGIIHTITIESQKRESELEQGLRGIYTPHQFVDFLWEKQS